MPPFFEKFIKNSQFTADDWKKALTENIQNLENIISDGPHILKPFIQNIIIPVVLTKSIVKLGDITWSDEELSFDVWPQYAILASLLEVTIKDKGEAAGVALLESISEPFEKLKELEENIMLEDFDAWMSENLSADYLEVIKKTLKIE